MDRMVVVGRRMKSAARGLCLDGVGKNHDEREYGAGDDRGRRKPRLRRRVVTAPNGC
jgi:hypothetical protein